MRPLPRPFLALLPIGALAGTLDAATFPAQYEPRRLTAAEGRVYTAVAAEASAGGTVGTLGDIDGDGLDEIVIGTEPWSERAEHYLLYGDADAHPSVLDPGTIGARGGVYIGGASALEAVGDFNGDGLDDWLLQPRDADALLVAGSAEPYPSPFDVAALGPGRVTRLPDTAPSERYERRSRVRAAGDYTGDGLADLVVLGDADYDDEATSLVLLPGVAGDLPPTLVHASAPAEHRASLRFALNYGHDAGIEWFGWGASLGPGGDLDGDGHDDLLLLSAWRSSPLQGAYVVFGGEAGLPPLIDFQSLDGRDGFAVLQRVPGAEQPGPGPGAPALASIALVGDTDGDGIDDLVAATSEPGLRDGQLDVVRGGARPWPALLTVAALRERAAWHADGTPGLVPVGAAGDIDGDGLDDWLVPGIHGSDVHVVYGRAEPFGDVALDLIDGVSGFTLKTTLGSDYLDPYRVAPAGDVDGDGVDDLLIGQPYAFGSLDDLDAALDDPDAGGAPRSGFAALVFGRRESGAPASPWAPHPALARELVELRWQMADGASPAGFELVRDGAAIATLDAGTRRFEDSGAAREVRHTYELITVDRAGRRSAPLLLSVNNDSPHYPEIGGAVYSDTLAEIFWVDDRGVDASVDIGTYTVYRDGVELTERRARSWLDEDYDPAGHTYRVEIEERAHDPRLAYTLRSATLALPAQDGTRPPAQARALRAQLRSIGTATLTWDAPPWGEPPLHYEVTADSVAIGTSAERTLLDTGVAREAPHRHYTVVTVDANDRRSPRAMLWADFRDAFQALLPTRAAALAVDAATESAVTLRWAADPVGVTASAYEIVRDGTPIGRTAATRYTDTALAPDSRHAYTVTGVNEDGLRSDPSVVEAVTAGGPFAPAEAHALAYGPNTVELFWSRAVGGATFVSAYEIERDGVPIATLDALSLMEYELEPDTTYRYTVRSIGPHGRRSAASATATVTTAAN